MATPTRSQGVSTPRNPLNSTPNRPTASPRPGTGHLQNRPFAHVSPAGKTPASVHSHSHRISISSQPTSTPIPAPAIHDELLNLNSPAAALIASIGNTGLTPLTTGQDGLGITAGIASALVAEAALPRNPELERLQRLQEVVTLLESKSLGRGVTRKGVIALAQREKFDQVWDGDTVNIAGESVDLEMTFDSDDKDVIRDVVLNLVTDETGDPQPQEAASTMLKQQLVMRHEDDTTVPWRSIGDFADNLHYLGHHDHLECSTNAFRLVGGLYHTFQKIWTEEKKRMRERHQALHICQGNVGRPNMDIGRKLGLSTQYWIDRHQFLSATASAVNADDSHARTWSASFTLNPGEPSISSSQNWLEAEPLSSSVTAENLFQENQMEKPNWKDESLDEIAKDATKQEEVDSMLIDGNGTKFPQTLGVQFVSHFEPPILVPVSVVTELNAQNPTSQINRANPTTYQQQLQSEANRHDTTSLSATPDSRWTRTLAVVSKDGTESSAEMAFMLSSRVGSWCYPLEQLSFSHPRQFTELLPILRQYALLWTLLRSTVVGTSTKTRDSPSNSTTIPTPIVQTKTTTSRSNRRPAQVQLDQLLHGQQEVRRVRNIDISLDLVSNPTQAQLNILIPFPAHRFVRVSIVVRRGGVLDVVSITGLPTLTDERLNKLKQQATRVLSLSEDMGILVCWLLSKSRLLS